jgi:hypothetical protein
MCLQGIFLRARESDIEGIAVADDVVDISAAFTRPGGYEVGCGSFLES